MILRIVRRRGLLMIPACNRSRSAAGTAYKDSCTGGRAAAFDERKRWVGDVRVRPTGHARRPAPALAAALPAVFPLAACWNLPTPQALDSGEETSRSG